jgi:ABC-type spermidine/putrescine transport system permease subunit II
MIFIFIPFIAIIPSSFAKSNMFSFPPENLSIEHYKNLFQDGQLWSSALLSLIIASISTILACTVGVMAALGIVKGNLPFKGMLESLFMGPLIIPLVTIGISFLIFFSIFNIQGSLLSIILAHSIVISPYIVRMACANLRQSDPVLEEAAIVHGASPLYMLRTVILPGMMPSIISGGIMAFLISMDEYTVTVFLAQTDTVTLPIRIYQYVTIDINPIITSFASIIIVFSFLFMIFLENKFKIHKYIEF